MLREFFLSLLLAAQLCTAQTARIKIDTDRVIGTVDPHVFGSFAEHLGRCIYGGIWDPGNPLSDRDGYRKDVMQATKDLGITLLRWPGGNFVSGYHWKDGIGPRDQRPPRRDGAWGNLEPNTFGTDDFLQYCERVGVEPYICINAGLGTVEEARQWVEYTNEAGDTYWARQRRKNGRDKPYDVKIWGLGNEIDGPWQLGHKNAEDYSKFALEAAKAMRREDGSIKLIASGSSNFRADWVGWNRTVLENLKSEIDYISLHTYIGNPDNNFEKYLAASRDLDDRIEVVGGLIQAIDATTPHQHPIYIAFDEWNVWYRARGGSEFEIAKTGLEEVYNYEDALAMGMFLNSFFRHANIVKMANLAQIVNVIAPMMTSKTGLYLQTIYFPIAEYAKQKNNKALDVWVKSPEYKPDVGRSLKYLDVSSTYDPNSHQVFVNVLNKSQNNDITARIENTSGSVSPQMRVWQLNHADLKTTHTFGDDHKVRPAETNANVTLQNGAFSYTFPKHSLTILKLKIQ